MNDKSPGERRPAESRLGPSRAQITIMGHNIQAIIAGNAKRRRRRLAAALTGVGAAAAIGIAVTAGTIAVRPAPDELLGSTFDCYLTPVIAPEVSRVAYLDEDVAAYGSRSAFALTLCEHVYDRAGVTPENPTVCELPDLRLAVFPNPAEQPAQQFCTALGLGLPDD